MKPKSFWQTKAFFWLFCFVVVIVLLFGATSDLSARNRPEKWKPNKEYQKRNARCKAEQVRIQSRYTAREYRR